jgi:sugar/nucleoside kinase (ribokinase family)
MPILCLGEAIVDLVCEREVDSIADVEAFRPHFGGALANVAVTAAREGAAVGLAGGVGDDDWGGWLRARLEAEGVDLRWFSTVAGLQTPLAFVTLDRRREPTFAIYGDGIAAGVVSVADRIDAALEQASALVFGSNTLVGEPERELTMHARALALERGVPVLFDPNIRPNRWRELDDAVGHCRQVAEGAFIVRANQDEAHLIAGVAPDEGVEAAAKGLVGLGSRIALVTRGSEGAIARGEVQAEAASPEVPVVSPMGAGDAFMGALAAGLAARDWAPHAVADVLPAATAAGANACRGWGAV